MNEPKTKVDNLPQKRPEVPTQLEKDVAQNGSNPAPELTSNKHKASKEAVNMKGPI